MRKDWWCEIDVSENYTIVVHEPGTLWGSDELTGKIVLRVSNIKEGETWLIPIHASAAEKVSQILSSLSFLQISRGRC